MQKTHKQGPPLKTNSISTERSATVHISHKSLFSRIHIEAQKEIR